MKIKAIYLKAGHKLPPDVIEIDDDIDYRELKKMLNCEHLDTTYRFFGNKRYTIFCDDEGWLKPRPITTAYSLIEVDKKTDKLEPALCGNLIICGFPKNELPTSLGLRDIVNILRHGTKIRDYYALLFLENYGN